MSAPAAETTLADHASEGYRTTLLSQAIRLACKAAAVVVMARLVSPGDHGRYAMAATVFFLIVLFRDAGLGAAAVQARELSETQRTTLWRAHALLGLLLATLAFVGAPFAAAFYREPAVADLLRAMALALVFIGFSGWPRVLLQRNLQFAALNRVETLGAVLGTVAMITAATQGAGAFAFVVFLLVSEAVNLAGAWRACSWRPTAAGEWRSLRGLAGTGGHVTGYNLLLTVVVQIDSLLMGRWFGANALGLYNRPGQMLALANQHVSAPLTQVLMAALSRAGDRAAEFRRETVVGASMVAHLTLPLAVACMVMPHDIVRLVLGGAWPAAAPLLRWLALGMAATYLSSPIYSLCIATGHTRRLAAMAAAVLGTLAVALVLGRPYGPVGLAAAVALTNVVLLLPRLAWAARGTPVRLRDFAAAYAGPLVVAAAFGLGLELGQAAVPAAPPIVRCALAGVAGAAGIGVCLASARIRGELRHVLTHLPWTRAKTRRPGAAGATT